MQEFTAVEELFRLAFEAGEEYADSLEWATYADSFPRWYEKRKDEILQTILNEQAKKQKAARAANKRAKQSRKKNR